MSTTYDGNSANYPTSLTIPSDGDGPTIKAADVNVPFEGLADRTANLDARLAPVEAGIILVNRATYVSVAALDISQPSPTATNTIFASGLTTIVGDGVEVSLLGTGSFAYGGSTTTGNNLVVEIWASQNGGSFSKLAYCKLGSTESPSLDANASVTKGAIALLGCMTISSAGTLSVEVRISFENTPTAGDLADVLLYRAALHQYRSP